VTGKGNYTGAATASFLIEASAERFTWGRDNWSFNNSGAFFDDHRVNAGVLEALADKFNLTETDKMQLPNGIAKYNANDAKNRMFTGSCFGMTVSAILAKQGDLRLSEVYRSEIPQADISVLSGPSHAEEVSRDIPTTVVIASDNKDTAEFLQNVFMTENFRVYTSDDIIGVELGGALKNVIALCAGISDGLGYGDNTKAALITRGVAEISRLGVAMGAKASTFAGLSGLGDLIVTGTSTLSRNHTAGELLGKGMDLDTVLKKVHMVVEGVKCLKAVYNAAKNLNVEMPIINEAYDVIYNNKNPLDCVNALMTREKRPEI
jgi:glycerol-3-phosphate dehydrogenase (NAD(P)+)